MSVNKAILIGHLGKDPEVRYTPEGAAVANFTLATNEVHTKKDGKKETRAEWHRIVAFGKLAEVCGEYLGKGKQVYIEGKIRTRQWEDREGDKRSATEIVASRMQMLGTAEKEANASPSAGNGHENLPADAEDVPF